MIAERLGLYFKVLVLAKGHMVKWGISGCREIYSLGLICGKTWLHHCIATSRFDRARSLVLFLVHGHLRS
jgi:hypothetical protein